MNTQTVSLALRTLGYSSAVAVLVVVLQSIYLAGR